MGSAIPFFKGQEIFNGYGSADFDIATAPLSYMAGDIPMNSDKKVVYRTDTGQQLGVHSKNYAPVAPKVMIDQARAIILRSGLNTNRIHETIRTSHNGSRTFVKYNLPEHTYETPDGDTACLNLLATTSIDSSWPFMISVAAIQAACLNLQIFTGGEVAVFRAKHSVNLDIEHGSRVIVKALDTFTQERDRWAAMTRRSVDPSVAFYMFADAAGCLDRVKDIAAEYGTDDPNIIMPNMLRVNKSLDYMWRIYKDHYAKRFGLTAWAVYNSMTDWSTHSMASSSNKNAANVLHNRQENVRQVVRQALPDLVAA